MEQKALKDMSTWSLGVSSITFPAWGQILAEGWQLLIGFMGAVVLGLTIYNKILEAKQRRRDLDQGSR